MPIKTKPAAKPKTSDKPAPEAYRAALKEIADMLHNPHPDVDDPDSVVAAVAEHLLAARHGGFQDGMGKVFDVARDEAAAIAGKAAAEALQGLGDRIRAKFANM